jgi:hypothetical protein
VIETAWRNGCRFDGWTETFKFDSWMQAFESEGVDPGFYANRQRSKDEVFPWDHIDTGVAREFLWREREKAFSGLKTPDCRNGNCNGCGFKGSECPGLPREDHR